MGRSGTKAVQLFVCKLLLEKYDQVKINYEPYFWKSRMGDYYYEGIHHHINTPLFSRKAEILNHQHRDFLHLLMNAAPQTPVVTKFIRATGRMDQINTLTKPNLIIVVVRDLMEVLNSIQRQSWNFYHIGAPIIDNFEVNFEDDLIAYARSISSQYSDIVLEDFEIFHSDLMKNALFWYLSNWQMLNSSNDFILLEYQNLSVKEDFLKEKLSVQHSKLRFESLTGSDIRNNNSIQNIDIDSKSWRNRWNTRIFHYSTRKKYIPAWYVRETTGDLVKVSSEKYSIQPHNTTLSKRLNLDNNQKNMIDRMSHHIKTLIAKKVA